MVWYVIQSVDPVIFVHSYTTFIVVSLLGGGVRNSMPMDQTFSKPPDNGAV